MRYTLLASLLAVAGVSGSKTSFVLPEDGSERVEHLRRVPEGWNEVGAPSEDMKMHFRIAVRSVSVTVRSVKDRRAFPSSVLSSRDLELLLGKFSLIVVGGSFFA